MTWFANSIRFTKAFPFWVNMIYGKKYSVSNFRKKCPTPLYWTFDYWELMFWKGCIFHYKTHKKRPQIEAFFYGNNFTKKRQHYSIIIFFQVLSEPFFSSTK